MSRLLCSIALLAILPYSGQAREQEKVVVKKLHMCCGGCADEVEDILKKVSGITEVTADKATRSASFTAANRTAAQSALDALAEGGFHGITENQGLSFKNDSGVKPGRVTSITVTGFHNSCPGCVKSFRVALKKVSGVTGDTCKSKVNTCEIKGNFDVAELVKALNEEGFHVKVK
jgi:copper chaperone CopZ